MRKALEPADGITKNVIFGDNSACLFHLNGFAKRLAHPPAHAYPRPMCRHITKEQHIEGWRAAIELLPKLRPGVLGDLAGALMARLHRGLCAAAGRRV